MSEQATTENWTPQTMGRKGGLIVRARYGLEHFAEIGRLGGSTLAQSRGPEYFARIGQIGGTSIRRKRGSGFYQEIAQRSRSRRNRIANPTHRLRELRVERNLTQAKLGEIVGLSASAISHIENERTAIGPYRTRLARALGVKGEDLEIR